MEIRYLQLIIPQYFISNKSGIWSLSLIVHSKDEDLTFLLFLSLFDLLSPVRTVRVLLPKVVRAPRPSPYVG